jgi:prepilin-type N-terminal cleavage/methylation domain-containing protein
MNAKNTDGFTFIETLVSIALILIVALAVSSAFISVIKHNAKASSTLYESWLILHADQELRKKIEPTIFPYWENSINAAQILARQIVENTGIPGITLTKAEIIIKDGSAHGLEIFYTVMENSTIYKSSILFSSAGDMIER